MYFIFCSAFVIIYLHILYLQKVVVEGWRPLCTAPNKAFFLFVSHTWWFLQVCWQKKWRIALFDLPEIGFRVSVLLLIIPTYTTFRIIFNIVIWDGLVIYMFVKQCTHFFVIDTIFFWEYVLEIFYFNIFVWEKELLLYS